MKFRFSHQTCYDKTMVIIPPLMLTNSLPEQLIIHLLILTRIIEITRTIQGDDLTKGFKFLNLRFVKFKK